jgi:integrase
LDYAGKFAQSTRQAQVFAFSLFTSAVSDRESVNAVTRKRVLDWADAVARNRTGGCANDCVKRLSAAWRWGVEYFGLPEVNPFRIPRYPHDDHPRYVPPLSDFEKVHALTSGQDYALLLTALHTAARRGELFRLTWDDIDFERCIIRLGTRKRAGGGLQYDWLPMTSVLIDCLRALQTVKGESPLVFPKKDGEPYKVRTLFFRRLCIKADVRRFGFHSIRHLSASLMALRGMPFTSIQSVLRHKNPLTTVTYLHRLGVVKEDLEKVFCSGVRNSN